MRLGLGTAQFGLDYGISNSTGRVPRDEVARILRRAAELGVRDIDTAAAYGESEEAIGQTLPADAEVRLVTKAIGVFPEAVTPATVRQVKETFHRSLERLRRSSVHAFLVHDPADLLGEGAPLLWDALEVLRAGGLCTRLGVSLCQLSEIEPIERGFPIDFVQVAVNVFDQRWPRSGWLKKLREKGVEIHVRSIFLQGLLLMDRRQLAPHFAPWREHFSAYAAFCEQRKWSLLEGALQYIRTVEEVDCVVLGVQSVAQFEELHAAWSKPCAGEGTIFERFSVTDEDLVQPERWKLAAAS